MPHQSRRSFLRHGLLGLAALPFGAALLSRSAQANELPRLSLDNGQARALDYVEVASEASNNAVWAEGETCSNCMFFNAENNGCQLFPRHSVEAKGWCQSWAPKA